MAAAQDSEDMSGDSAEQDAINLEAELNETLHTFEQMQADLSYQQAQSSLKQLLQRLDLTSRERSGVETELNHLQTMLDKLEQQIVHIAVFGMVSRGKSSLLNALLGESVFEVGPTHGVTRKSQRASWSVLESEQDGIVRIALNGIGRSRIELIDTPGIDEIAGEERERLAQEVAQQADLILFVIAGDMTRVEYDALVTLRQASKPILLVFNKIDQYPETDRQTIYAKIRNERVRELLSSDEIVMAAAAPLIAQPIQQSDGSWTAQLVPGPPQIEDLKLKILEILDREGKALVALNTLLYADEMHGRIVERKWQIRDHRANDIIWQSTIAKSLATALNPIAVVDVVSSAVVDIVLILTLSKLYGITMTQQDALTLLRKIAIALGGISISETLMNVGLGSLKSLLGLATAATGGASLVPYVSVALTQAAIAGVSTYGIGQVTKQYLANGASWGSNSPKVVVQEILAAIDQDYILGRIKTELQSRIQPSRLRKSPRNFDRGEKA
jgi:GTPase